MIARRIVILCLFLSCVLVGFSACAEDSPSPRVGRIAAVDGNVAVRQAGGEWIDSGVNEPIAAGMSVRTSPQGRVTLRSGAETIALAAATELDLTELDASGTQIVLHRGRVGVRLSELDAARSIEIDIPRGGVWLLTPGDYDITAGDEQLPTRVAVLDGLARLVGKGVDSTVATGSATVLSGRDPVVSSLDGTATDDFVASWRPADGSPADPSALRYVSPEMTGYEALDGNGSWQVVAGYGDVWFPKAVSDDWVPYRYGHWRWIAPWGWSWIDDMDWGFAPSHYGRWARIAGPGDGTERWGWVPGKPVAHPIYMAAAVAFLGTAGVGLSCPDAIGPAVAWFPLAPGEVYWPSYTHDVDMIREINAGAVADASAIAPEINGEPPADIVNGEYHNRSFASVVPRLVFLAGRPVAPAIVQLPERRLENAPLLAGSPQIAPLPPRAAAVASATAPGNRGIAPRLARAMQTLARILRPHVASAATRAVVLAHSAQTPGRHSRMSSAHPARPRVVAAVLRNARPHLRLAAVHRRP